MRSQGARDKGINKGIMYVPRLSFAFGSLYVLLGNLIAGVTAVTTVRMRD
jgi:hypothetical protein